MKHEIKIEFKDTKFLLDFIKSAYNNGILSDRSKKLDFDKDTNIYDLCKGLYNHTVRLCNNEIIDGSLRLIIEENKENKDGISLYPCSIFYEMEHEKFSFII